VKTIVQDPTETFFEDLARRGHASIIADVTGTIRIDAVNGRRPTHWFIEINSGDIVVSRKAGPADCIVRTDKETLDAIVTGRSKPITAVLRGALTFEGDPALLVLFQRLLPSPPATRSRIH
jgi:hypothetical protein